MTPPLDLRAVDMAQPGDFDRARALFTALCPGSDDMWYCVLPGEPISKARPRFLKSGRAYNSARQREAEKRIAWRLRRLFTQPLRGNVALGCIFFRPDRQRIDVDNMLKNVCDAATSIAWLDDSQVTGLMGLAELDPEHPRTIIVFGRHISTLTRGEDATKPCVQCGSPMPLVGRSPRAKYCSTACAYAARPVSLVEPVPCARCEQSFRRKTTTQKYCGVACSNAAKPGSPRPAQRKDRPCHAGCGRQVSKSGYQYCRACWAAMQHKQASLLDDIPAGPAGVPPAGDAAPAHVTRSTP
jgi:Holliday junction resolvase RusA-like endonuclease